MNLLEENSSFDRNEVKITIENIYQNREPEIRVEEMEKFFHGAYESIDEVIAYLVSVGFIQHDSKKRTDGKTYDKNYFITKSCADKMPYNLSY